MFVLWISMVVSVWSGIDYYVRVLRVLQRKPSVTPVKRAVI
jgi:hypothetical protein